MSDNPFSDSTNPYQPSSAPPGPIVVDARSRLLPPAIILIVFALMTIAATLVQIPRLLDDDNVTLADVAVSFFPALINLAVITGAIHMIRLKSYSSAMTAAILSVIPVCSPCFILGIPFGIWAIIVLRNPAVQAQFHIEPKHLDHYRNAGSNPSERRVTESWPL